MCRLLRCRMGWRGICSGIWRGGRIESDMYVFMYGWMDGLFGVDTEVGGGTTRVETLLFS